MVRISKSRWTTRLAAGLLAFAAASAASLVSAEAARADDSYAMEFSTDGTNWTPVYSSQLFQGVLVVPGGSATRAFWVRNDAPDQGVLRVTLADVTTNDTRLADAMSIATSTPTLTGTPVALSAAQPCATLSQGQLVGAGDGVRLDNALALADLTGSAGQVSWVSFVLRITFSSTDLAAPAPNTCPSDAPTVPGIPVPPTTGTETGSTTTSTAVYHRTASGWKPGVATSPAVVVPPAPTTPVVPEPTDPFVRTLAANTFRLYQEYDVALWLTMLALGALILVAVRRRRYLAEDRQLLAPHPNTDPHDPTSQIGTPR